MSAEPPQTETPPQGWLNRNVVGIGVTSFLADVGYETATAVLPGFLQSLGTAASQVAGGAAALWLGLMEGLADATSSSVKLASGWWGDRVGKRKPVVVLGYLLSGGMTFLFTFGILPLLVVGRVLAWFGKGIRGPLRNAILAESVPAAHRGKAFGFHQAADTLGAIVGPLLAVWLLTLFQTHGSADASSALRTVLYLSLIPGIGSALVFACLVREKPRAANPQMRLWASVNALPRGFRRLLVGVGAFGAGDFAHILLILAATEALRPAHGDEAVKLGIYLYALRNLFHAAAAYTAGALSDRLGRRGLLLAGYALGTGVMTGFAVTFQTGSANAWWLGVLFALAGTFVAIEEVLEKALTADLVPDESLRGTAYGVLGTVNGFGDLLSSVLVGVLWWFAGPVPGFVCAAVLMLVGTVILQRVK